MTEPASNSLKETVARGIPRRYRSEQLFRTSGMLALLIGLAFLAFFFYTLIGNGYSAFWQTRVTLEINLDEAVIDPDGTRDPEVIAAANFQGIIRDALRERFPDVTARSELRSLFALVSPGARFELRDRVLSDPTLIGSTLSLPVLADDDVDMLIKGYSSRDVPEADRRLDDLQIQWVDSLIESAQIGLNFNRQFFISGDSRDPELAGIWSATVGSFYMLLVTLALSFPLGVATAIYLEEFAPRNRWTDLIEVNINNLAAVPSIVFGLLGLALFINLFGLPRSAPLVGGLVLSLMTLPVIIIASRAALTAVPPSIREAALGIGASRMQMVLHHVLPLAMRYGACARRICATADDRYGGVHRGRAELAGRSGDCVASAGLSLGGLAGTCVRRTHIRGDYRFAIVFAADECRGYSVTKTF